MLTSQIFMQLIVILLVVQMFGFLCKFIGQPGVIGEILGGLALGPTLLGAILPRVEATLFPNSALPTLQTLGDIGSMVAEARQLLSGLSRLAAEIERDPSQVLFGDRREGYRPR